MSFLYPLFLAGLAAIAVPILLHLFRRKTERVVDFPAVRLLHRTPVEQQRRRRIREWILLALRVSALALLAFAFARPYLPTEASTVPMPVTVVALDTSLSMSAPGQWPRAQDAAREAIREAPATHNVALVTFADAATVVVPATTDREGVIAAIGQTNPGGNGTRYRTALARAAETITSGQGRIVVVTDLQQAGWEANDEGAVPDGIDVQVAEVGAPPQNLAVTAARRDADGIVAAIHNFGLSAARVPVGLRIGDREVATQTVAVAPQGAAEVRFTTPLPQAGGAAVHLTDESGYVGDNTRYVALEPPEPRQILIVTADAPQSSNAGFYVERALSVSDDGDAFQPRVFDGRAFSALSDAEVNAAAAMIVLGTTSLDRAGRERVAAFLRSGGRVLLTLGPDLDPATLSDTVGVGLSVTGEVESGGQRAATLVAVDTRHPVFRPFSNPTSALGDVSIDRYRRLDLSDEETQVTVLARFSGGDHALVERPIERGRLLVFASDLDNRWNRFPLNPAFVPWLIETARYLAQDRGHRQQFTLPAVPPGLPVEAGVHEVASGTVVVNPDIRESNPARLTPDEFIAAVARSAGTEAAQSGLLAREQEERQRLWQFGLLVMFVALASEGLIGRRAV